VVTGYPPTDSHQPTGSKPVRKDQHNSPITVMPTQIQCAITRGSTETNFEFMLPDQVVTVTVPGVVTEEQCGKVIGLFVDSVTTGQQEAGPGGE